MHRPGSYTAHTPAFILDEEANTTATLSHMLFQEKKFIAFVIISAHCIYSTVSANAYDNKKLLSRNFKHEKYIKHVVLSEVKPFVLHL